MKLQGMGLFSRIGCSIFGSSFLSERGAVDVTPTVEPEPTVEPDPNEETNPLEGIEPEEGQLFTGDEPDPEPTVQADPTGGSDSQVQLIEGVEYSPNEQGQLVDGKGVTLTQRYAQVQRLLDKTQAQLESLGQNQNQQYVQPAFVPPVQVDPEGIHEASGMQNKELSGLEGYLMPKIEQIINNAMNPLVQNSADQALQTQIQQAQATPKYAPLFADPAMTAELHQALADLTPQGKMTANIVAKAANMVMGDHLDSLLHNTGQQAVNRDRTKRQITKVGSLGRSAPSTAQPRVTMTPKLAAYMKQTGLMNPTLAYNSMMNIDKQTTAFNKNGGN